MAENSDFSLKKEVAQEFQEIHEDLKILRIKFS